MTVLSTFERWRPAGFVWLDEAIKLSEPNWHLECDKLANALYLGFEWSEAKSNTDYAGLCFFLKAQGL